MKLITVTQVTVDGVMQGNGGASDEDRRNGFERGGWALGMGNGETMAFINETYQRADAFLFGRKTYELFGGYWGAEERARAARDDPGNHPITAALNTKPKYLASTTLTEARWANTTLLSGDLAEAVGELKAQPGGELQVHGSGVLIRWLLENDLVDEIVLLVVPVVLGQARGCSRKPGRTSRSTWSSRGSTRRAWRSRSTGPPGARSIRPPPRADAPRPPRRGGLRRGAARTDDFGLVVKSYHRSAPTRLEAPMSKLKLNITMSLDGYVAGPDQSTQNPLGLGGEQLHGWLVPLKAFRESHGEEGGEVNASTPFAEDILAGAGATIMGRNMFGGGPGPWENDSWKGWWGDNPPFHHPVFVLTHHPREPLELEGGTTFHFVTDGIESALDQARAAADGREVSLGGGASAAQQYLAAGLLDEIVVALVPILLGGGARLFDNLGVAAPTLEQVEAAAAPGVTHIRYRRAG